MSRYASAAPTRPRSTPLLYGPRRSGARLAGWLLASALLGPTLTLAQAPEDPPAQGAADAEREEEARRRFAAGAVAVREGDYEAALRHFLHAYELRPHPALLYNIANAADRLRDDETAAEHYRRYLADVPDAENRRFVEHRLELIDARSSADDEERATEPEPTPQHDPRPEPQDTTAAWVVMIGGLAVLAGGGATLGLGLAERASVEDAADGARWRDVEGSYQNAEVLVPTGIAALGVGAALAVAGGALLALSPIDDERELTLRLGPGSVALGGRFR